MHYCLYYWIIAPLRGGIEDTPELVPAFTLPVQADEQKTYEFSLYCDERGDPKFARCRIPDLETEAIPESLLPLLQILQEHLLTVLRLTYDPHASLAKPACIWGFFENGTPHKVNLAASEILNDAYIYNPEPTKNLFLQALDFRELLRLFADSGDDRIPLQYRFLSLYKLLELQYRKSGKWEKKRLSEIFSRYENDFKALDIKNDPVALLHELRDKCAHIRTVGKGNRMVFGVTQLNHSELTRVSRVLPVVRAVCAASINECTVDKFQLSSKVVFDDLKLRPSEP